KRISIEQIAKAVEGTFIHKEFLKQGYINRVIIDSRQVQKNDLYIPIVGERFDGHDFINEANRAGAICVFSRSGEEVPKDVPAIIVKDTKKALGDLAAFYRQQFTIPFIGITGSVGKTSSKEMLASILETKFIVHKTDGNYNNDIGLPLSILSLESDAEVAIIELGMNHFGEIDYLASILKPEIGVITNIGLSHIEFLGSQEGIFKAKTEMLPHIQQEGLIVVNGDDAYLRPLKNQYGRRVKTYGYDEENDGCVVNYQVLDEGRQKMTVASDRGIYSLTVDYPGEHILLNAVGGILIGEYLGIEKENIIKGIQKYEPAKMRLNEYNIGNRLRIIDDAYNASVDSMTGALKTLGALKKTTERSVAILGSMFEMGSYSKKGHEQVGHKVVESRPDVCILIGEETKWTYDVVRRFGGEVIQTYYYNNVEEFLESIEEHILDYDIVLLKASRGMAFEKIREALIGKFEVE
ncbi:UDP-N-acetylmuramoyl-tripeptide--D-alanyl-D-alanine ligase, partial [Petrocella sp. FN5]|uniref:UDP-N-acetylmuramoyl-tripeptide--D-alanyl-D- alanine ligase n=1 Tax=Petrocella sp. FN5 TaxID=3032002 RepID=UPI0023DB19E4